MAKSKREQLLRDVGAEATDIGAQLTSISDALKKASTAYGQAAGESSKVFQASFTNSLNLAKSLKEFTEAGLRSSRERAKIEKQIKEEEKEIARLARERAMAEARLVNATKEEEKALLKIIEKYNDAIESSEQLVKNGEDLKAEFVEIEKNLGITGKLLDGISQIPIVNKFIDTKKALEAANEEAGKFTGNRWTVLGATLKSLGGSLKRNLTDPLVLLGAAGGILSTLFKIMTHVDQEIVNIGRNFGVGRDRARELFYELEHVAEHSTNVLMTSKATTEAFEELNGLTGTLADISGENLESYVNLTKAVGLSKDGAQMFYKFSVLSGRTLKETSSEIAGQVKAQLVQNKSSLSQKNIMEGLAKTTAAQRLSLKGGTQALIDSVIQAKKLGMEMNQLEGIADSLLDIESSIENELSAELVVGRELNVEAARYYAQTNQTGELAKVLAKDLGSAAEFSRMGRIEQQMLASAYGLSREQVAETLENQEMLSRLGSKSIEDLDARYRRGELTLAQIKEMGSEELASQVQNIGFQEKLNALIEKAKDLFTQQLAKPGGPIDRFLKATDNWLKGGGMDRLVEQIQGVAHAFGKIFEWFTSPATLKTMGVIAAIVTGRGLKNMIMGRPGSSPMNPMYVQDVGGGLLDGGGGNGPLGKIRRFGAQFVPGAKMMSSTGSGAYAMNGKAFNAAGKQLYGAAATNVLKSSGAYMGPGSKMLTSFGKFGASSMGKFMGGPGGLVAGMVLDPLTSIAADALKGPNGEDNWKSDTVSTVGSTASNALTGAAIGSMILPGIGTAIGAIAGGLWGLGSSLFGIYDREEEKKRQEEEAARQLEQQVNSANKQYASQQKNTIMQRYSSFSGSSTGAGAASGVDRTNNLLEQLVNVVSSNRNIDMNGNQVGTFVGMESYSMS
jgi:hypothetical protein